MTTTSWLALAAAVLLTAGPSATASRLGGLGATGRVLPAAGRHGGAPSSGRPGFAARITGAAAAASAATTLAVATVSWLCWSRGPVLGVAVAVPVAVAAVLITDTVRRRAALAAHRDLVAAVRILEAELASGSRPATAFAAAATAGPQVRDVFDRAAEQARLGLDAAAVLEDDPRAPVRAVGLAWRLGHDTGLALGAVLERVGTDLVAADEQRRTVAVVLAGPRSSAVLLAGLPTIGLALGTAMGASPLAVLTGHSGGQLLCLVGVLLDAAGVLWVRAILRRAEAA